MNIREKNIEVFEDTKRLSETNEYLKSAIYESSHKQYIVKESDSISVAKGHRFKQAAEIVVSKKRSLEAASKYFGQKVCVHNFASAVSPGGYVVKGSTTQEDAICRCSTLYFNISEPKIVNEFYNAHREMLRVEKMDSTYNDDCIYTPGVIVFKSDTYIPELLEDDYWYKVDIITCAAPNIKGNLGNDKQLSEEELRNLHIKRLSRILSIAKMEKEDVVVLGAFGCGAFGNPAKTVARAMKEVLQEYVYDFKAIELAIFCTQKDVRNYRIFKDIVES